MSENLYQAPEAEIPQATVEVNIPESLNPWKSMWLQPRLTIRYLLSKDPTYMVVLLAIISGIYQSLDQAATQSKGDTSSLGMILGSSLVGGVMGGMIGLFLFSWLQSVTGRWLGGVANSEQVRLVYAWSTVPGLVGVSILILQILVFRNDVFSSEMPIVDSSLLNQVLFWSSSIIQMILAIWSIALHIIGVAEVHVISKWRAFFAIILAFLLILGVIAILVLPFVIFGLMK